MFLERLDIRNFQSFGDPGATIRFDEKLTAFLGGNSTGKTAASQAILRLFSVIADQRVIRLGDFHVPADEMTSPPARDLRIEAVFEFPELDNPSGKPETTVPEFFRHMTADEDGHLKLRIVLESRWTDEGGSNGTITTQRRIAYTFDEDYETRSTRFDDSARDKIQAIYVPATRDGAREVSNFLRGRLWRAGQWSDDFSTHLATAADQLSERFRDENVVRAVTGVVTTRWKQLHHLKSDTTPTLQPINRELRVLVANTELLFEPSPTGRTRPAAELSDGQRSLLHIALTAASLDLEKEIVSGAHAETFNLTPSALPVLTILIMEEPENNLSPFFLSRVVRQLLTLADGGRAQAVISSHSASVVTRLEPEQIRHFGLRSRALTTRVKEIPLPGRDTDAGKYMRQAVRAYPELYFARFVVLGEGDSEQVVLPILAQARGVHIDQSFVSVVPLGGRHTNYFWMLLRGLGIPHATLLDLDYGRAGGGEGRIRDVCRNLQLVGINPFKDAPNNVSAIEDLTNMTARNIASWMKHLRKWNVYFATPLDLDMSLMTKYPAYYQVPLDGGRGPSNTDARDAVLGDKAVRPAISYWDSPTTMTQLRWYRYLFLTNSKPSAHIRVLPQIPKGELDQVKGGLGALLNRIAKTVGDA